MAWNGKYIEIDSIIESVFRDTEYKNEVALDDMISWTGEAIELIGCPVHLTEKITDGNESLYHPEPIEVEDFRAKLPDDLHKLESVLDKNGTRYLPAEGNLHMGLQAEGLPLKYRLQNNMIFVNKKETTLYITYKSLPVSNTGLPLVPDNIKFTQAVKSYLIERLDYKLWRRGLITDKVYQKSEQERLFYVGAAQTSMIAPDEDEMEVISNIRLRLYPEINDWGSFNSNLGEREQRNIRASNNRAYGGDAQYNVSINSFDTNNDI